LEQENYKINQKELEFYYNKYKSSRTKLFGEEAILKELAEIKQRLGYARLFKNLNILIDIQPKKDHVKRLKLIDNNSNLELAFSKGKVRVLEFSDFGCYYCANSQVKSKILRDKYKGNLSWVYKNLPDEDKDSKTFKAHIYFNCVLNNDLSNSKKLFDLIYRNYKNLNTDNLVDYSNEVQIPAKLIDLCISILDKNTNHSRKIVKDINEAKSLNIKGTPSYIVDDTVLVGEIDIEKMSRVIEQKLKY
jgi:protein-disulfide isomerase